MPDGNEFIADLFNHHLDCLGQSCAMVVQEIDQIMNTMMPGTVLKIITEDDNSNNVIPQWCKSTSNEYKGLIKTFSNEGDMMIFNHYIKKL
jgi:TusA-related sulfurtransferase